MAQDRALREDVRWLAAHLGDVVRRVEGEACFAEVEALRTASKARRRGRPDAPSLEDLLSRVSQLPLDLAARVARAFATFFLLINTAEQVHRVRRRRDYRRRNSGAQPGSPEWVFSRLENKGHSAEQARSLIASLEVRPVLTAHPTESARRTILSLQGRVAELLLARDDAGQNERAAIEAALDSEIELLWLTSEVRKTRPTVYDEIATATWYLEDRLLRADSLAEREIARAFERVFREKLGVSAPLVLGSWVGGDRDGNPMVTPEVTLYAARRASRAVLEYFLRQTRDLIDRLAVSTSIAPPSVALQESIERDRALLPEIFLANQQRNADEPLRMKLSFVAARLEARISAKSGAYRSGEELVADLDLIACELSAAGASSTLSTLLLPFRDQAARLGFHGMRLDVREDSGAHAAALDGITNALGVPAFDRAALENELRGRRPLLGPQLQLDEQTAKCVETFRTISLIQAEIGENAANTYIISMAKTADDILRVLVLAREAGLLDLSGEKPRSSLDVVPLFETLADLENAPLVFRELVSNPTYQKQLEARGRRMEIMIGYSDSAKDAGVLTAAWALYRAQEILAAEAENSEVSLSLFHGRGGTVGRGGGSPVYRALTALPPDTLGRGLKITEQGEVVSQKFGILELAERSLEVMFSGAWTAAMEDWRSGLAAGEEARFRGIMDELSAAALPVFRRLVHEEPATFRLLSEVTPIRALGHVHYGSRPAFRPKAGGTMAGIRAIPWGFGWTQIRLNLPAWLGVGAAFSQILARPDGLETLQRMAKVWPFFDDLLGKIEMVLAKCDLEIARLYVENLGGDRRVFGDIEAEFHRAVETVLKIRGKKSLLEGEMLAATIALRNPYVDPLNCLQVHFLRRSSAVDSDEAAYSAPLASTINGIAQGMRNTG